MKKATFFRICSTLIMITLFSNVLSFAWLSTRWQSTNQQTISFKSGDVTAPRFTMWIYDTSDDADEDNPWIVYFTDANDDQTDEEKKIDTVVVDSSNNLTEVTGHLQFGMVTSLVEETNENDIYMCFEIDGADLTAKHYTSIKIDYHYCDRYVDVYKEGDTNTLVTDADKAGGDLYTSLTENDLINENYVVITESDIEDAKIKEDTTKYDMTEDSATVIGLFEGYPGSLSQDADTFEEIVMQDETFYIYVKLSLNRENLRESLELLTDNMPCYLVFNIYIGVEPVVEGAST